MQSLTRVRTAMPDATQDISVTRHNKATDAASRTGRATARKCGPAGGGGGSLGTTAESAAAFPMKGVQKDAWKQGLHEFTDATTGEVFFARRAHDCSLVVVRSPAEKRVLRYERKAAAAVILGKRHRIAACHANPVKNASSVDVWAKQGVALPGHFQGLQTCALPWLCSVCAPKIAERRAAEIEGAMTICKAQGGQVLMPTFTAPHTRLDRLADTLDAIIKARRLMSSMRRYKQLQASLSVKGRVIATEITHGESNGWHPHFHELWFFEHAGVDVLALELDLYRLWRDACVKCGLGEPSRAHGVKVQDGSRAAQYVSKMGSKEWGLADEISKASAKGGRNGSRSAWELLDCYMDPEATPQHQKRAEGLFREYAEATKGRRQLVWTPGLKKFYAVVELDDAELCAQNEEDAILVAQIPLDAWRAIRVQKMQAQILNAVQYGAQAVQDLVEYCVRISVTRHAKGEPA